MKRRMNRSAAILLLSCLGLAGGSSFAAEFEVLDRFSVDGYSVLRGSADIPGGSFTVGGSTFVVKSGNIGVGTANPGGKFEVAGGSSILRGLDTQKDIAAFGSASGDFKVVISTAGNLNVSGEIKLGYSASSCGSEAAGTLRWYDGHISVCNGTNWRQLDNQAPPTITSITPTSGLLTLQTAITIDGSGFTPGPEVLIDGVTATNITVVSTTRITATTPAGTLGQKAVKITNPDGQYVTGSFTYNPAPTITAVNPASGLKAAAITITGTGFAAGAVVKIGDTDAASVWVSATQITATTPSNSFINAKDVKVTNSDTGTATLTNGFTYFAGTGGTITTPPGYRVHTFTTGGTFTANAGGNVEALIVAGGGGGGSWYAGGGGAGGLIYAASSIVTAGGYTVVVGAGGAGRPATIAGVNATDAYGSKGSNSSFNSLIAYGGGGGPGYNSQGRADIEDGGSGAGGRPNSYDSSYSYGRGTAGQGNNGAPGDGNGSNDFRGGGGGGAGGAGSPGTSTGAGGVGLQYSISGTATYYAGGGGGGAGNTAGNTTAGGTGGGGTGRSTVSGSNAVANTGGGGGGSTALDPPGGGVGGNGGSGIVIIRYPN